MIVQGSTDHYNYNTYGHERTRAERFEREVQSKNKMYDTHRDYEKQSCISSIGSTNLSDHTLNTAKSSVFPGTASYVSSVYAKSDFGGEFASPNESAKFAQQMERLNLLAKYNGINIPERSKMVSEHGEEFVMIKNGFVQLKPKLKMPIAKGKFARWFQVVDPNSSIRDDIKMARGVLRKDRFQHPTQLDTYLGVKAYEESRRQRDRDDDDRKSGDKDQQYRVKRVRNKLKHWNAMYKQLNDAIGSVDNSNYSLREKVQHVDQICSIYIGRAERAIDCFYAEPGAHFMLDMVVSLQKKVSDAQAINRSYQAALDNNAIV